MTQRFTPLVPPPPQGILTVEEQQHLLRDIQTELELAKQASHPYDGPNNRSYQPPPATTHGIGRHALQYGCAFELRHSPKCPVSKHRTPANGALLNHAKITTSILLLRQDGIKPEREVAPMPVCLTSVLERMYEKGLFSDGQRPDSAMIDIFNQGDCMVSEANPSC